MPPTFKLWFGGGPEVDQVRVGVPALLYFLPVIRHLLSSFTSALLDVVLDCEQAIAEMFKNDIEKAAGGQYDSWEGGYEGLALCILLDQFTR